MEELLGSHIGKYEIKEVLGSGAMGKVYKAYHPALQRDVAIKIIRSEILDDPIAVRRFRREATIVAALRHPNIVQIHDFDIEGDMLYMVMEYIPGANLKNRLSVMDEQKKRMPLPEALHLFQLICQAVAYAHQQSVIHLDLKPANVLITPRGRPILADFGLSKIVGAERIAEAGMITGTPSYMSPEQCRGEAGDERSDIYSLGVMLYELVTGSLPFSGDTLVALIMKHLDELPPPPRSLVPELPEPLEAIIQKALQKSPAERYPSALALLEALDEVVVPIGGVPSVLLDVETPLPEDIRCPYRGLQVFEEQHAEFYFGREALVHQLVSYHAAIAANLRGDRFLTIMGASGSGKSSLVRAGLIPALRAGAASGNTSWTVCLMKPGERPLEELAAQLAPLLNNAPNAMGNGHHAPTTSDLKGKLATDGRMLHLAVRQAWMPSLPGQRLLLIVDQFEEIFTLCHDEMERRRFIENLLYATAVSDGPVVVLPTMRADFYHHCADYRDLANRISAHHILVGAMETAELQRAIEQPAQRVGLKFEPGLINAILADIAQEPGALPLLQHALLELWERRQGRLLTLRAYQASGGVQGAIAQRADAIYQSLSPDEQAIVRRIMLRLTEPGEEGAQPTRRRGKLANFVLRPEDTPIVATVLKQLADARLITTDEATVEVAHEALIRGWPRLQGWLEADQEGLRLHHHLAQAAQEWANLNRDPGELYRGARLATATEWATGHAGELNSLEREFLQASQELAQRQEVEQETQRQRELAQAQELAEAERQRAETQSKSSMRLRFLAIILLLLLGLALAAIQVAVSGQRVLDARRLAFAAQSQLESAPETALLLAYEAAARRPEFESEQALRDSLAAFTWRPARFSGHEDQLLSGLFSPDGQHILTASADGTARLWDLSNQSFISLAGHEDWVVSAVFDPAGERILTASRDGTARLWDPQGQTLATFEGHEARVTSAVFSPDGQQVLTASNDGTARLWDPQGQTLATFEGHEAGVTSAVFSPDGQQVLTASDDSTARLWDLEGQTLATFEGHEGAITRALISPNGQYILTAAEDGTAQLWDLAGQSLVTLPHRENITNAVFSPDGQTVFTTAGRENTVQRWDLSGQPLSTFHGHSRAVRGIVFSPDGQRVLTASDDGTARLWDLTGQPLATFKGHTSPVVSAVFSPDGQQVLTASSDSTAQVWQEVGQLLPTLRGHEDEVESAVFSADSQRILTASTDGTARLWDLEGHSLVVFEGHEEQVDNALFSPDEQYVLTSSEDGTARLWDLEGQTLATFSHDDEVGSAAFSPDGRQVLTASNDTTARLWQLDGQLLVTFTGHEGELQGAVFSSNGQRVLTTAEDGTARLWDLSGQALAVLEVDDGQLQTALFSPDGQRILTASGDGTAKLWDLAGQLLVILTGHQDRIEQAIFSPDGEYILTASWDRTAQLWDLNGRSVATFAGHTNAVKWAVFSPDGQRVLTASDDGTARLWNLDGQPLAILRGHENWVASAVFSPDGRRIVTASRDFTSRQYLANIEELLAAAACRVGRGLTAEEIEHFQVGRPRFVFAQRQCPAVLER
jgi:WD40 repeat protein/tRNA A-37 threonylcarbamoyl transferase component Bud32